MKITHTAGERPLHWLFSEFARCIHIMKDILPIRCIVQGEPQVIALKPVPIPDKLDPRRYQREDKWAVNRIVDKIKRGSLTFDTINTGAILPSDVNYFEESGNLSPAGHKAYWHFVNVASQNRDVKTNDQMLLNRRRKCNANKNF